MSQLTSQHPQQTSWDGISPSPGRAARKMVVFQASCVMFFAGIHKFSSYGVVWLDGGTILKSLHPGNDARIDMLRAFVAEHSGFFVAPMATVSVIGELSSVFAFLSSKYRHFIVLCWVKFHIGVRPQARMFACSALAYFNFLFASRIILTTSLLVTTLY